MPKKKLDSLQNSSEVEEATVLSYDMLQEDTQIHYPVEAIEH